MVLVDYIGIFFTCANTFGYIHVAYKHNKQINNQNIDKTECFGVKFVKFYPEMASQYFFEIIWF
jgi:hypothetical protein